MNKDWPITVNSEPSFTAYCATIRKYYDEYHYLTFSEPRIGPDRSLDQNALLHVWAAECWFHYQSLPKGKIKSDEMESIKRSLKKMAYIENRWPWLLHTVVDVFDGNKSKKDYTSSKTWARGEMYMFLTWLQMRAANDGLILESKGEFNKLQREHG